MGGARLSSSMNARPDERHASVAEGSLASLLAPAWNPEIRAADGTLFGRLSFLAADEVSTWDERSPLVATLCKWRNTNAHCFLDPSRVTPESTLQWLRNLTGSPDRLLFVIFDDADQPIAQYGLKRLSTEIVELDNGILGIRSGRPDMFFWIQQRILDLCRSQLGFLEARARVISDNVPALFLHKRSGLTKVEVLRHQAPGGKDVVIMAATLNKPKSCES